MSLDTNVDPRIQKHLSIHKMNKGCADVRCRGPLGGASSLQRRANRLESLRVVGRKLIGNNHNAGRGQKRQNRFETGRKPAARLIALGVVSFSGPRSDFIVYSSAVVYLVDEAQ
jgi:hypothetical protein